MRDILKPYGAFIEYTVKPLFDQARELIELMEKNGIPAKELKSIAIKMYVFHGVLNFVLTITITVLICLTCLTILR